MRKHPREHAIPKSSPYVRAGRVLLCVAIVAVSTVIAAAAMDTFREPKEIVSRAVAILFVVLAVFAVTEKNAAGAWRDHRMPRVEIALCVGVVLWTLITAAVSTNRMLSFESTVTVLSAVVLFVAARLLAPQFSWTLLDVCFASTVVNAIMIVLQEYAIWNPFRFSEENTGHIRSTALIGNPDDVGTFLVGPAVAALVGAWTVRGKRRIVYAAVAAVAFAGLVASGSRAALAAVVVGAIAFALHRPWKQSFAAAGAIAAVLIVILSASPSVRNRFTTLIAAARHRKYDVLFSERLVPFLTAVDMIRSHPLTGVGPGCFKFHYMDERLALSGRYPAAWTKGWPQNFAETHNDFLQVTAETGLPGYALFLAALFIAGKAARSPTDVASGARHVFARALRIPLVTAFFVVALAQFPLQIAAPRMMFLVLGAITLGWDERDA